MKEHIPQQKQVTEYGLTYWIDGDVCSLCGELLVVGCSKECKGDISPKLYTQSELEEKIKEERLKVLKEIGSMSRKVVTYTELIGYEWIRKDWIDAEIKLLKSK